MYCEGTLREGIVRTKVMSRCLVVRLLLLWLLHDSACVWQGVCCYNCLPVLVKELCRFRSLILVIY